MAVARIWFEGRLGRDPELKFSQAGKAYANFGVACTERVREGDDWVDGNTTWYDCVVFGKQAENAVEALRKGDLVTVGGRHKLEYFEGKDGATRASAAVTVESIGKVPVAPKRDSWDEPAPF